MTTIFKIKIGDAQLMVERSGAGKAIIFLHAGVADRRMWHHQMAALAEDYLVVAYDRRGFGETTAVNEPFSHVEDLRELLDQLEIARASLIGCSQGGRIAIDFALAYPHRVTAVVLIAPAISGAPAPEEAFPPAIQAHIDALDEAEEANDLARVNAIEANLWLDGPTSTAGRVNDAVRKLFLEMNGVALRLPELTKEIEPASAYKRLPDLSQPTLVIWGTLDFPHIQKRCQYLVENLPAATGKEIADTAHLPNLEQPEIINELLRTFAARGD